MIHEYRMSEYKDTDDDFMFIALKQWALLQSHYVHYVTQIFWYTKIAHILLLVNSVETVSQFLKY